MSIGWPPSESVDAIIDGLIGGARVDPQAMVLFDEILTVAHHDERACGEVERAYGVLSARIGDGLSARFPGAPEEDRAVVARALVQLSDNEYRFRALGFSDADAAERSRAAARMLLRGLG